MKITIFSDSHCGYEFDEERGIDSFAGLEECIERNKDSDLILIAGDIFDSRTPRQEVFAKTAKILGKAQNIPSHTQLLDVISKDKSQISPSALKGIPIVAIHGTHERRSKHMINPLQALEHAGLLVHLHCGTVVFNIGAGNSSSRINYIGAGNSSSRINYIGAPTNDRFDQAQGAQKSYISSGSSSSHINYIGEHTEEKWHQEPSEQKYKVAIHGMSGVPERFAKDCLLSWNPKPVKDAVNILMLHQSIDPYIYSPLEPPTLKLEDLPQGFDLYVLGHIHWREKKKFRNSLILLPGSTTTTSLRKIESSQEKCFYNYNGHDLETHPLKSQRKIIWYEFEYKPNIKKEIEDKIINIAAMENTMQKNENNISGLSEQKLDHGQGPQKLNLKPIFVARIKGKLPKGEAPPNFNDLEIKYKDKVILNVSKRLESEDFENYIQFIRMLRKQRLSPEEQGMKILNEFIAQNKCGINSEDIFDLLVEGNIEMIFNLLTGKQSTLQNNISERTEQKFQQTESEHI